jgi:hypothetical protein
MAISSSTKLRHSASVTGGSALRSEPNRSSVRIIAEFPCRQAGPDAPASVCSRTGEPHVAETTANVNPRPARSHAYSELKFAAQVYLGP